MFVVFICFTVTVAPGTLLKLTYTYVYKGRLKTKPHPERKAIAEKLYCGNTLPLFAKLEKPIQICLNFCAWEAHTTVRGVQQMQYTYMYSVCLCVCVCVSAYKIYYTLVIALIVGRDGIGLS